MHTHHPSPLDPPLAISYRNHQKSLAYFSYLAPSILFFFIKRQSQKGVMAQCLPQIRSCLDYTEAETNHDLCYHSGPQLEANA